MRRVPGQVLRFAAMASREKFVRAQPLAVVLGANCFGLASVSEAKPKQFGRCQGRTARRMPRRTTASAPTASDSFPR
jgi:hypothetical protein